MHIVLTNQRRLTLQDEQNRNQYTVDTYDDETNRFMQSKLVYKNTKTTLDAYLHIYPNAFYDKSIPFDELKWRGLSKWF